MDARTINYDYGSMLVLLTTAAMRLVYIINNEAENNIIHFAYSNYDLDKIPLVEAKHELYKADLEELFKKIKILKMRTRVISNSQTLEEYTSLQIQINDALDKIKLPNEPEVQKLFNENIEIIKKQTNLCVEQLKNEFEQRKAIAGSTTSESQQEAFDLKLIHSKDLKEAKEKYELELENLNTKIFNLTNGNRDFTDPKAKLLKSYHDQMARLDKTDIMNLDIGRLQLQRVKFNLENKGQNAVVKDENLIHTQTSSRPILGAILLTGAVLLGLASIALCVTVKLAPIGIAGLLLAAKLAAMGTGMMGLSLGLSSIYFFTAKTDLTKKTESTLQKLSTIQSSR